VRRLRKRCRAQRANRVFADLSEVRASLAIVKGSEAQRAESLKGDANSFFEEVFGFTPYKYKLELADMFAKNQFIAARWCRQSGKSFTVSALLLKYAWENPGSYIAIVGPSWRQTKLNIRRMGGFARKLSCQQGMHIQKTRITLPNDSVRPHVQDYLARRSKLRFKRRGTLRCDTVHSGHHQRQADCDFDAVEHGFAFLEDVQPQGLLRLCTVTCFLGERC
jgi:hypothetical protein